MTTATIRAVVAKKCRVEEVLYEYAATGETHMADPLQLFDPPRPIPDAKGSLDNEELEKLAKKRQPPPSWYEGEEEQLF